MSRINITSGMIGGSGVNKVQKAKLENQIKAEIAKQVDEVRKQIQAEYDKRLKVACDAVRRTYEQYQADTAAIALNDLGWGEARINRFLNTWADVYDSYQQAMTGNDEADYLRVHMDERLKRICKSNRKTGERLPEFEKRYEFLPEIKYEIQEGDN